MALIYYCTDRRDVEQKFLDPPSLMAKSCCGWDRACPTALITLRGLTEWLMGPSQSCCLFISLWGKMGEKEEKEKKTDRKLQLSNDVTSKAVSTVFHMWESGKWEVDCSREYLMTHFTFFYFSELFHAIREREWERTREAMGKAYECHSNLTLSKRQWWIRRLTVSMAPGHCLSCVSWWPNGLWNELPRCSYGGLDKLSCSVLYHKSVIDWGKNSFSRCAHLRTYVKSILCVLCLRD